MCAISNILLMAHLVCGAPLVVLKKKITNGAPWYSAPLLVDIVMAHHTHRAPLVVLKKKIVSNGAPVDSGCGAPLLV